MDGTTQKPEIQKSLAQTTYRAIQKANNIKLNKQVSESNHNYNKML